MISLSLCLWRFSNNLGLVNCSHLKMVSSVVKTHLHHCL
uniref:Uncharacterized protein n=1 Tax=Arundo donax TaxID=35708 RepID=A0A0A9A6Y6_ARUDO